MENRGRFQAQGERLDESEPWAQNLPLKIQDGLLLHKALKSKLKRKDLRLRYKAFNECENFIKKASENGGIDSKMYPHKASWSWVAYKEERVDLEVKKRNSFYKEQRK